MAKKAKARFDPDLAACRMASLALADAAVFHEVLCSIRLAGVPRQVTPLRKIISESDPVKALAEEWDYIITKIDYVPIFFVAREILLNLPSNPETVEALKQIANLASWLTTKRAALSHDLMGRIYHRLLADAKYYGAYYTTLPAATLLLKLALDRGDWDIDWSNPEETAKLRVCDFSCGTGTLLKAALEAVVDNVVAERADLGLPINVAEISAGIIEDVLWGFDVLPFAAHLAASALALNNPDAQLRKMRVYHLPLGGPSHRLGSVDFLVSKFVTVQKNLLGATAADSAARVTGAGDSAEPIEIPKFDLCVMNPPFVRSSAAGLLFGSLPAALRNEVQTQLKNVIKTTKVKAKASAGLGAVFVALGDRYLGEKGTLALVLPKACLAGVAWHPTRELLGGYQVEFIISSHEPKHWNFSENTNLSEVLIVARRSGARSDDSPCTYVNLYRQARNSFEALALSESLRRSKPPPLLGSTAIGSLKVGAFEFGEVVAVPQARLRANHWMIAAAFRQTDLSRVAAYLDGGLVYVPGAGKPIPLPLRPLKDVCSLGPDIARLHDAFEVVATPTPYPALWNHDSQAVRTIAEGPNSYLRTKQRTRASRYGSYASHLWNFRGTVAVAERLRINTQRVSAIRSPQELLANTWWVCRLSAEESRREVGEKALVLWLNSTLGVIGMVANGNETIGAFRNFKKPNLKAMPVLDVRKLPKETLSAIATGYDSLATRELLPLAEADLDPVRKEIDDLFSTSLGIPGLGPVRKMFSNEGWA